MKSGAGLHFSKMDTKKVKELLEMGVQFDKNLQSWCQSHNILGLLYLHFYIILHSSNNSSQHIEKSCDRITTTFLCLQQDIPKQRNVQILWQYSEVFSPGPLYSIQFWRLILSGPLFYSSIPGRRRCLVLTEVLILT